MDPQEPQNRFTRREKATQSSAGRVIFFVFLGCLASVGWTYLFFVSDAFMLRDIEVRGLVSLDPLDVKREVYRSMDEHPHPFWQPSRHLLFLHTTDLEKNLKENLFAERVTVDKSSNNVLRLLVEERARRFILKTPTQFFWIDIQGTVLHELSTEERKNAETRATAILGPATYDAPIIFLDQQTTIQSGERIHADEKTIRGWLDVALEAQKQGIQHRQIQPEAGTSSTRILVKTFQGYDIWFDTSTDTLKTQIEAYTAFIKQRPKDLRIEEYVDVRIPGRVYVK